MSNLQEKAIIKAGSAIDRQGKQRYLSDIEGFDDLPDNCHFNKVLTGCGGTTVALKNSIKYVIAMPFKGIGENKRAWAEENKVELCIIDGDTTIDSEEKGVTSRIKKIQSFVKDGGQKIIVTYDSLPDVVEALGNKVKDWKLLVDESHMLLEAGSYRYGAVDGILININKFKSYCLMTATPVKDEYQLSLLKDIPKVSIEWDNIETVNIERRTTKKNIDDYAALLVLDYLNGEKGKVSNAHIFLNSVNSITAIMRKVKKAYKGINLAEQVKIVASNRSENRAKIKADLGTSYSIGHTTQAANKINFYTSTAFAGQDIHDEYAISYVIVDGRKDNTKLDITTTIPQIIGRIRNARVKNKLTMLYSADEFTKYLNRDTYESQVLKQLEKAKGTVNDYKSVSEGTKEILQEAAANDEYLFYREETDELVVNDIAQLSKLNAFDTQHATYKVAAGSESKSHNLIINTINYAYTASPLPELEGISKLVLDQKPDFKSLCLEYIQYRQSYMLASLFEQELPAIEEGDTLDVIQRAYEKLGPEKMKALDYRQKAFKAELIVKDTKTNNHQKVRDILDLKLNDKLTLPQAKEKLQYAYSELNIDAKPTARNLEEYYCIDYKKINDPKTGRRVDGIIIGAPKATNFKY